MKDLTMFPKKWTNLKIDNIFLFVLNLLLLLDPPYVYVDKTRANDLILVLEQVTKRNLINKLLKFSDRNKIYKDSGSKENL